MDEVYKENRHSEHQAHTLRKIIYIKNLVTESILINFKHLKCLRDV